MFSEKEVNEIYKQYQIDLKIGFQMPRLKIIFDEDCKDQAYIRKIDFQIAEIILGNEFFDSEINKKYLVSVLYHEFTHIVDRCLFFNGIKNEKKKRNLLFPYNEFHAAQVELTKMLELFYNPHKNVKQSTNIYDMDGSKTLKSFQNEQKNEFSLYSNFLDEHPSIENIQSVIYIIVYNIGYYVVCSKYNIDNNLFISTEKYPYIEESIKDLKVLLLNNKPSEKLCIKAHSVISEIANVMAQKYNLL